jgi:hypothetical protein
MTRGRIIGESVCIVIMSLWLGMIGMAGYFAAILFPTMKRLDPRLPGFESYTGDHWRIAAGKVAAQVFGAVSIAPLWVVGLYLFVFGGMCFSARNARESRTRFLTVFAVYLGSTAINSVFGRMQHLIEAHWEAARSGEQALAASTQQEFAAMHPWATGAMLVDAAFAITLMVMSVRALTRGLLARPATSTPAPASAEAPQTLALR